jgi:phosphonate degradation associated HDIG domain protein
MAFSTSDIIGIFQNHAGKQYGGEAVSQLEHALQCADLADKAGETDATIVAALLHDLGHLITAPNPDTPDNQLERDDLHQYLAMPFLQGVFPDAVLEPIRLHVDAKRYLCGAEPSYWETLSPESKRSLTLQGGPFTEEVLSTFIAQDFAHEAVRLRRYDDLAKIPHKETPSLDYFAQKLMKVSITSPQ